MSSREQAQDTFVKASANQSGDSLQPPTKRQKTTTDLSITGDEARSSDETAAVTADRDRTGQMAAFAKSVNQEQPPSSTTSAPASPSPSLESEQSDASDPFGYGPDREIREAAYLIMGRISDELATPNKLNKNRQIETARQEFTEKHTKQNPANTEPRHDKLAPIPIDKTPELVQGLGFVVEPVQIKAPLAIESNKPPGVSVDQVCAICGKGKTGERLSLCECIVCGKHFHVECQIVGFDLDYTTFYDWLEQSTASKSKKKVYEQEYITLSHVQMRLKRCAECYTHMGDDAGRIGGRFIATVTYENRDTNEERVRIMKKKENGDNTLYPFDSVARVDNEEDMTPDSTDDDSQSDSGQTGKFSPTFSPDLFPTFPDAKTHYARYKKLVALFVKSLNGDPSRAQRYINSIARQFRIAIEGPITDIERPGRLVLPTDVSPQTFTETATDDDSADVIVVKPSIPELLDDDTDYHQTRRQPKFTRDVVWDATQNSSGTVVVTRQATEVEKNAITNAGETVNKLRYTDQGSSGGIDLWEYNKNKDDTSNHQFYPMTAKWEDLDGQEKEFWDTVAQAWTKWWTEKESNQTYYTGIAEPPPPPNKNTKSGAEKQDKQPQVAPTAPDAPATKLSLQTLLAAAENAPKIQSSQPVPVVAPPSKKSVVVSFAELLEGARNGPKINR